MTVEMPCDAVRHAFCVLVWSLKSSLKFAVGDPNAVKQVTGQDQGTFLADPQVVNSYNYGRDNPITQKDPNGNTVLDLLVIQVFKGASFAEGIGTATDNAGNFLPMYGNPNYSASQQIGTAIDVGIPLTLTLVRSFSPAAVTVTLWRTLIKPFMED